MPRSLEEIVRVLNAANQPFGTTTGEVAEAGKVVRELIEEVRELRAAAQRIAVVITRRLADYHACLRDHPGTWGCGPTAEGAWHALYRTAVSHGYPNDAAKYEIEAAEVFCRPGPLPSPLWYCPEFAELINRVNFAGNPNMMVYDEGAEEIAKGLDDDRP